jgi:hypothetical protein
MGKWQLTVKLLARTEKDRASAFLDPKDKDSIMMAINDLFDDLRPCILMKEATLLAAMFKMYFEP